MTIVTQSLLGKTNEPMKQQPVAKTAGVPEPLDTEFCIANEPTGPLWVPVKLEEVVAAIIMAVLALITLANVIARYVVDISLAFTEEYSIVLLLILVFVGVSSAVAKNSHIKVTFFLDRLSCRTRQKFEFVGDLAMLVCFGVLVFYGTRSAVASWELGETSPGLGNPQWLYLMWVPILAAVAMLRVVGSLIRLVRNWSAG